MYGPPILKLDNVYLPLTCAVVPDTVPVGVCSAIIFAPNKASPVFSVMVPVIFEVVVCANTLVLIIKIKEHKISNFNFIFLGIYSFLINCKSKVKKKSTENSRL